MHSEVRTLRLSLNWHISLLVYARHKEKNKTRQKGYLLVVILIDSLSF